MKMGCHIYNSTCSLCYIKASTVSALCIQDNYHILSQIHGIQAIFAKYNLYSCIPICDICLMKLRVFVKCRATNFDSKRMQDFQQAKEHIEDTNCKCDNCQAKFGNLPLLAEVIEKLETKNVRQPVSEPEVLNKLIESGEDSVSECEQPSTSRAETVIQKKTMKCEYCGKVFTHRGDLNKHLRKHTGEQPFQCPVCARKFAHTSNLARHIRVHSGDKPFTCERCSKSFSRKDKLILHQKTKLCLNAAASSSKS